MIHLARFLFLLVVAFGVKKSAQASGLIPPWLAAWELAALGHVFLFAWQMMDFKGFTYATPRFNSLFRKVTLISMFFLLLLKFALVVLETQQVDLENGTRPLIQFLGRGAVFETVLREIAPYIIIIPLFFFLFANLIALAHVKRQTKALQLKQTKQEADLKRVIRFVDLPVILPFLVVFIWVKLDRPPQDESNYITLIGCVALTASNLLTGFVQRDFRGT